ncbi:MAG TPA: GntG family PLP-dependent aldolase [Candidatus Thermoplasmatota archaeon]|nr:GntG family PLP-dependent aldolase [Candidatus Thermoplasmatota archaeon]
MHIVDLRSDTVTKPTPEMRQAMARAEVGNASWGEDPTVNELERRSAELFGKEAAMFVVSGTMGNQTALRAWAHKRIAPEIICHERAHIYVNEAAGVATVAGAQLRPLPGKGGRIPLDALQRAVQPVNPVKAQTALLALENTHNWENGAVLGLDHHREVRAWAQSIGLPIHLDGARIFNAATYAGRSVKDFAAEVDSVQFCFSKGLACPVGSMVVGPRAFIDDARKVRQSVGGALRQAGVLAAPALIGLDTMTKRLHEDHTNCRRLASGLKGTPLAFDEPQTNILVMDASATGLTAAQVIAACAKENVLFSPISATEFRAVTHCDVSTSDIDRAVDVLRSVLGR